MPEYLAPGVYVEEVSFRNKSIEGVSTTTTGFVGPARYGPVDLESEIVTSLVEFERTYGDRGQLVYGDNPPLHNYLWHAVRAFFEEGGKRLYVGRIFRPLVPSGGTERPYERPSGDISAGDTAADDREISLDGSNYYDGHARAWLPATPTAGAGSRDSSVLIRARFPGAAGNFRVTFTAKLGQNLIGTTGTGADEQRTARGLRNYDTVWIEDVTSPVTSPPSGGSFYVARFDDAEQTWIFGRTADDTSPSAFRLNSTTPGANVLGAGDKVRVVTLTVTVATTDGTATTVWDNIALDPNHENAFGGKDSLTSLFAQEPGSISQARTLPIVILAGDNIDNAADFLSVVAGSGLNALNAALADPDSPDSARSVEVLLTGGNDGQRPTFAQYEGNVDAETNAKFGLKAFEDLEDISIVAAPGSTAGFNDNKTDASATVNALISHATRMRYRIAVLDSGDNQSISDVRDMRAKIDSSYAALYYPWVRVLDPVTGSEINLPPSGFVSGIYARNDVNRAVYKAPANEVVNLALGFEKMLNRAQQEVLNPEGVNCFRYFEGRGMRLWGARTASSDPEWKYVNLRRYFAYLERSIDKGTQWAVFEPNGPRLWDNVRSTVADFLLNEWTMGALLGDKPERAYFVRCDRSTMTQNDLDNGRLVCLVGVAPLKPAEFVIFRIGQWTADRKV
jgi:phage tail sheath protein FI